jgi:glucokinase
MLLAGDIGGTKTTLALFASDETLHDAPSAERTFPSGQYASLAAIVREFLTQTGTQVDVASFGVAGPVAEGRATITNLPWKLDAADMAGELGIAAVYLLNDLEAAAYAIPALDASDLRTLNAGEPDGGTTHAVIAPGTGLGEAFITHDGRRTHVHPSEGGHCDFAPTDDVQLGLLRYLQQHDGHVSYERVCSGIGLPNIYAYLKNSGAAPEPDWLAAQLAAAHDQTPVIVNTALDQSRPSSLCAATLQLFVAILGAEAGNLALKVLATGGVYMGGGIPPRILPFLEDASFMRAFTNKGRFGELLARIPVHVILNPKIALIGAARYGFMQAALHYA